MDVHKKQVSLLLALALIVLLVLPLQVDAAFENTYVLTGNQRKDILGVAATQIGYVEGPYKDKQYGNDTKYGDWYGLPYNEWCAMFVSWCARQADISTDILQNSCRAGEDPDNFNIACYSGEEYTPQPGDLFFKNDFSHVGLVYEVKGDTFITLEGNVNYEGVSEIDGFTVTYLERKIADCFFGVPEYEGCDTCTATGGDHQYTRKHDGAHPHANYFECDLCGDLYYTGSHAHVTACGSCMSCGCSTSYAGLYKVVDVSNYLTLRSGHGIYYAFESIADLDQTVEVLAGDGRWAHIVDGPNVFYGSMDYLQRYVPTPGNFSADGTTKVDGETVTLSWDPARTATSYQLQLLRNGEQILNSDLGDVRQYTLQDLEPGKYQAYITASYAGTVSKAAACDFRILATYAINYDGRGGANVPAAQTKIEDRELILDPAVPEKEGYIFLGWNDNADANFGIYQPGDVWTSNSGATMYAIWREETAAPASLEIRKPAKTALYFVGDSLNTDGLELMLHYSDGTAERVSGGYEVSGFSSETAGDVTVTLTYQGVSASYTVTVVDFLPGDIDRSRVINKDDVMQLLWHISFPDMFPIDVPADFTGDGRVDKDDVMQLLWHISFPDMFPLM